MYESRANQPGFPAFVYIRGCLLPPNDLPAKHLAELR